MLNFFSRYPDLKIYTLYIFIYIYIYIYIHVAGISNINGLAAQGLCQQQKYMYFLDIYVFEIMICIL